MNTGYRIKPVKRSRALGLALTPKAGKYMNKRPYPPGQHGPSQRPGRKVSDYKEQLMEKQRLRAQYNIHERQMRNYFARAQKKTGNTADLLIQLLESRLDAVVLRSGLARTIYAARQYVSHKHITVNGKSVNIPSFRVRVGDTIAIAEKSKNMICFKDSLFNAEEAPGYLEVNKEEMTVNMKYYPKRDEVPVICEMSLVIEFYSR